MRCAATRCRPCGPKRSADGLTSGAGWLVNAPPPQTYDDEYDLGEPMQLVADTGDTSADGADLQDAAETMGAEGSGDDLLG